VRARSTPRIAGGVNYSRRTSSFQAKPYEPHGRLGTVMRLVRAHITWAQTARGAKRPARKCARAMRDGCAMCSYHFSASRRLPHTHLILSAPAQCDRLLRAGAECSRSSSTPNTARARHRLRACPTDGDVNMHMDQIFANDYPWTSIGGLVCVMLANIIQ
jgi:hypothetical protein